MIHPHQHARLQALGAAFCLAFLLNSALAQTPSQTLTDVQNLLAEGGKGAALALLGARLPGLTPGDSNADALLEFAFEITRFSPVVRSKAAAAMTAAQALRMAGAAQGVKPLWLERDLRARWRELEGTGASATFRLAQLAAIVDPAEAEAIALLDAVIDGESGATNQEREDAQALRGALAGPENMDQLEAAWDLWQDRVAAKVAMERIQAAARAYAEGAAKEFYASFLANGSANHVGQAEHRLLEALLATRQRAVCATVADRVIAREGAHANDVGFARYAKAQTLAFGRDREAAVQAFWIFIQNHPEHALVADALYEIGDNLAASNDRALALDSFDLCVELYPETNAAFKSSERLRQWYERPGFENLRQRSHDAIRKLPAGYPRLGAVESLRRHRLAEAAKAPAAPVKTASADQKIFGEVR